jgi:hypothetical protein
MDQHGKGNEEIHEPGEYDLRLPGEQVDNQSYKEEDHSDKDILGVKQHCKENIEGDKSLDDIGKIHAWRAHTHAIEISIESIF